MKYNGRCLTNSVDWDTGSNPFLDMADHTIQLRVGGGIQALQDQNICKIKRAKGYNSLIVIDVELCIWVSSTGCFKSDPYIVFADDIVEDAFTQRAILVEDFVHNILRSINNVQD